MFVEIVVRADVEAVVKPVVRAALGRGLRFGRRRGVGGVFCTAAEVFAPVAGQRAVGEVVAQQEAEGFLFELFEGFCGEGVEQGEGLGTAVDESGEAAGLIPGFELLKEVLILQAEGCAAVAEAV